MRPRGPPIGRPLESIGPPIIPGLPIIPGPPIIPTMLGGAYPIWPWNGMPAGGPRTVPGGLWNKESSANAQRGVPLVLRMCACELISLSSLSGHEAKDQGWADAVPERTPAVAALLHADARAVRSGRTHPRRSGVRHRIPDPKRDQPAHGHRPRERTATRTFEC